MVPILTPLTLQMAPSLICLHPHLAVVQAQTHTREEATPAQLAAESVQPTGGSFPGDLRGPSSDPELCSVLLIALSFPPLFLSIPYLTPRTGGFHLSFLQLEHLSDERDSVADAPAAVWGTQTG